jgi:hypothetical protein
MRYVSCQREVGEEFFVELLVSILGLYSVLQLISSTVVYIVLEKVCRNNDMYDLLCL